MGFGSYDESEQQKHDVDTDDDESAVNVHENDHDGTVRFETEATTDDLLNRLSDIKANETEDSE